MWREKNELHFFFLLNYPFSGRANLGKFCMYAYFSSLIYGQIKILIQFCEVWSLINSNLCVKSQVRWYKVSGLVDTNKQTN